MDDKEDSVIVPPEQPEMSFISSGNYVGGWQLGGPSGLTIFLDKKPDVFRRFFMRLFFNIKWVKPS